jgi:hypothetical protein
MTPSEEQRLHELRERYHATRTELLVAVRGLCPGRHRPVQHRDRKPPWCDTCGRDQLGTQRREERTSD